MGRLLVLLVQKLGGLLVAFVGLFLAWATSVGVQDVYERHGPDGPAAAELVLVHERLAAELDTVRQARADAAESLAATERALGALRANQEAAAGLHAEAQAAIGRVQRQADAVAAEVTSRARAERSRWDREVTSACQDGAWYRVLDNMARNAACEAARRGRDEALARLAAWQDARAADADRLRGEVVAWRGRADEAAADVMRRGMEEATLGQTAAAQRQELATLLDTIERLQDRERLAREARARAETARDATESWWVARWHESWRWILGALVGVVLLPYVLRTMIYYGLMAGITRAKAMQLVPPMGGGSVTCSEAERTLRVRLAQGQVLRARAAAVRPLAPGVSKTQWWYDWRMPFVSAAAGMVILTRVRASDDSGPVELTLAPPGADAADRYVMRVDLRQHTGVVIHPRHLLAVQGDLKIRRHWRLASIHAWATGQLRYLVVEGTGALFLEGVGDLRAEPLQGQARQESPGAIVLWDARLSYRARRTETFVPYLLQGDRLVEVVFEGDGVFVWQKCDTATGVGPVQRAANAFWSVLGRVLGF